MRATLSGELKGKFELVGDHHDHVVTGWGEIRFSKLTDKHANALIARGYMGIRKIEAPTAETAIVPVEAEAISSEEKLSAKRKKKEEPA
jgi:hypothetical protein